MKGLFFKWFSVLCFQFFNPTGLNRLGFQGCDCKCHPSVVQQTQMPINLAKLLVVFLRKSKLSSVTQRTVWWIGEQNIDPFVPLSCENHAFAAGSAFSGRRALESRVPVWRQSVPAELDAASVTTFEMFRWCLPSVWRQRRLHGAVR